MTRLLRRLRRLVADALDRTRDLWPDIRRAYGWVHGAARILNNAADLDAAAVARRFAGLVAAIGRHRAKAGALAGAVDHFLKVTRSYRPACSTATPSPTCRAPTTTSSGCSGRTAVTSGGRPAARPTARRPCCAARCGCSPVWPPGCAAGTPAIWPAPIGRAGARCAPASSAVGTPACCGRSSAAIPPPTSAGSNSSSASQLCRPSFFARRRDRGS